MRKFLQVRFHGGWIGLERPGIQGDHVAYPVDDKAVEVVPVEGDNRHLTELFLGRRQAQPSPDIDSRDDPSPEVERAQHFSRCERYRRNRIVRENVLNASDQNAEEDRKSTRLNSSHVAI